MQATETGQDWSKGTGCQEKEKKSEEVKIRRKSEKGAAGACPK